MGPHAQRGNLAQLVRLDPDEAPLGVDAARRVADKGGVDVRPLHLVHRLGLCGRARIGRRGNAVLRVHQVGRAHGALEIDAHFGARLLGDIVRPIVFFETVDQRPDPVFPRALAVILANKSLPPRATGFHLLLRQPNVVQAVGMTLRRKIVARAAEKVLKVPRDKLCKPRHRLCPRVVNARLRNLPVARVHCRQHDERVDRNHALVILEGPVRMHKIVDNFGEGIHPSRGGVVHLLTEQRERAGEVEKCADGLVGSAKGVVGHRDLHGSVEQRRADNGALRVGAVWQVGFAGAGGEEGRVSHT